MNKCDCYKTIKKLCYSPFCNQSYYQTVGICNGTKEREECYCDGDKIRCSFYPDVRDKAKCELEYERGKTNADKIRSMTNEELADFFFESPEIEFEVCEHCKNFGGHASSTPCKHDMGLCYVADKNEAFKKWLQQPCKD